jgi:hypothetical protein
MHWIAEKGVLQHLSNYFIAQLTAEWLEFYWPKSNSYLADKKRGKYW